jgi:predicted site-specific integrase-resolvase
MDDKRREMLSAEQAAHYLQVASQTLARWRAEGVGPAFIKVGGLVRYEVSDLNAFLDSRRRNASADNRKRSL